MADVDTAGTVVLDQTTRKTYRYLRVAVVGMTLLLVTSLVIEIVWGDGPMLGSISAYYYTPVKAVFIGALVAIGPALVAIKGRPGWEDAVLDLAGMVIPVVAFVPTPLKHGCGAGIATCLPPELVPGVENNVSALLVVGAVALVFAWWSARPRGRAMTIALLVATGAWLAFGLWFVLSRDTFLTGAHYAAAITFFVLIAGVAWINGRRAPERGNVRGMTPHGYAGTYKVISLLMALTIVVAGVLYGGAALTGHKLWFATIFVVEAILLALFVVFWVLQTAENWNEEAVETAPPVP
ncbi:hypothetical protein [Cellulomonas sp. ICMP 17802]|uniref:hypothetical protein n=1 Tax=Cellulomonas sp. ICMP 17802 TaxID=3239199 RepID=UPI00351B0594